MPICSRLTLAIFPPPWESTSAISNASLGGKAAQFASAIAKSAKAYSARSRTPTTHPRRRNPRPSLRNSISRLSRLRAINSARAADHYQRSWERAGQDAGASPAHGGLDKVNEELLRSEHALTDPNGLPGRPWYKHQLYAPGFYTGYGVKTIPAVREAIEQHQWPLAQQSIVSVAKMITDEAAVVERAANDLDAALQ